MFNANTSHVRLSPVNYHSVGNWAWQFYLLRFRYSIEQNTVILSLYRNSLDAIVSLYLHFNIPLLHDFCWKKVNFQPPCFSVTELNSPNKLKQVLDFLGIKRQQPSFYIKTSDDLVYFNKESENFGNCLLDYMKYARHKVDEMFTGPITKAKHWCDVKQMFWTSPADETIYSMSQWFVLIKSINVVWVPFLHNFRR